MDKEVRINPETSGPEAQCCKEQIDRNPEGVQCEGAESTRELRPTACTIPPCTASQSGNFFAPSI